MPGPPPMTQMTPAYANGPLIDVQPLSVPHEMVSALHVDTVEAVNVVAMANGPLIDVQPASLPWTMPVTP